MTDRNKTAARLAIAKTRGTSAWRNVKREARHTAGKQARRRSALVARLAA